jgi:hypothetical protein
MRIRAFFLTAFVLLCGCATKSVSIDPSQDIDAGVCKWAFTGSMNYEATSKGQGTAKSYKCTLGSATIYRYTADRSGWTDSKDDLLAMVRMNHPGIVQSYKNNGVTAEAAVLAAKNGQFYVINGKSVAAVRYDLRDAKGNKSTSYLFLTADAGEILKYRISYADYNKDFTTDVSLALLLKSIPPASESGK